MNRRTWITLVAAGPVAAAFDTDGQSGRPLKDVVADAERSFAGAMAARDLAAFASHISPEAVFFSSADGSQVLRGKTAIVEGWKRLFEGPTAPFSWLPDTAQVLDSGTLAMTTGPVRDPKGQVTGRFSSVWRLDGDGQWRVIFDRGCGCAG
ncbi:MAG TPA: nuclear transport factor 2 family protein [Vicinamibacterales bacterium]|jgi:ketosteroid isomerase-like protein